MNAATAPVLRDGTVVLVAFTRALAAAGLPVVPERTAAFLAAVDALQVGKGRDVYWAGRLSLAANPDHLPVYDAVFAAYFSSAPPGFQRFPRPSEPPTRIVLPLTQAPSDSGDSDAAPPVVQATAAAAEVLRHRDLGTLTAAEKQEMAVILELLRPGLPERPSRRRSPYHRGPVDPRRTVRAMLAAGGEPGVPARHHRRRRPRRIVLLIDVSGSMAPYSDALLRFAHVLHRRRPGTVETFTLGTRLTRITRALAHRDPDRALAAAADTIPDYSGGTRLGDTVQAFLERWGRRDRAGRRRGAVLGRLGAWLSRPTGGAGVAAQQAHPQSDLGQPAQG